MPDDPIFFSLLAGAFGLVCFVLGMVTMAMTMGIRATLRADQKLAAEEDKAAGPVSLPVTAVGAGVLDALTVAEQDATALAADFPMPAVVDGHEVDDRYRFVADETRRDPALAPALAAAEQDASAIVAETLKPEPLDDPAMQAALDAVLQLEAEGHSADMTQRLDPADMHDVYGDDEPDDDSPPPPPAEPLQAEAVQSMVTMLSPRPARDWSQSPSWSPPDGVVPNRWMLYRWRLRTWWDGQRREAAALQLMRPRGWQPGEVKQVIGRHRPEWLRENRAAAPRPVGRVLRPDWRDMLRQPKRTYVPSLPFARSMP